MDVPFVGSAIKHSLGRSILGLTLALVSSRNNFVDLKLGGFPLPSDFLRCSAIPFSSRFALTKPFHRAGGVGHLRTSVEYCRVLAGAQPAETVTLPPER